MALELRVCPPWLRVLAPQKWIDTNPKAVQAFVDATREGWKQYLFGNPAPANAIIKKDNAEMTDGLIAQAIAKMKSYGIVTPANIGGMTDARYPSLSCWIRLTLLTWIRLTHWHSSYGICAM